MNIVKRNRWLPIAAAVAVGVATFGGFDAGYASAAAPSIGDTPISIELAKSIGEPDSMRKWMSEAAAGGMADGGVALDEVAPGHGLVISVEGELLAYRFSVAVRSAGRVENVADHVECECNDDELVARVRVAVAAAAPRLRSADPVPPPTVPAEGAQPPADNRERKLGPTGKAGVALLTVGGTVAIAGIVMVALPPRYRVDTEAPAEEVGKTLRAPGVALAALGVAALTTGAVLLARDPVRRRRSGRSSVAMVPGIRGVAFSATVRF